MSRVNKKAKPVARISTGTDKQAKTLAREAALMETLHDAEIRQQQSFIKSRSQQLDQEIKALRQQLKMSDDSIENDSLKAKVASVDLNVKGFGLGRVEFDNDKYTQDVTKMKVNLPQFQLDEARSNIQPKTVKDHLVMFLAKIKLKMEDVNMSSAELRELLLPSDLVVPDEYTIPIGELTGVLQTDLLMPVTKGDQIMILDAYGTNEGEVDVRALLNDAGVWYDGPTTRDLVSPERRRNPAEEALAGKPGTMLRYPYSPEQSPARGERLGTLTAEDGSPQSPMSRAVLSRLDPLSRDYTRASTLTQHPGALPDKTAQILDLSERNLDELQALHEMILDEKEYDYGAVPETKRKPFENYHPEGEPMKTQTRDMKSTTTSGAVPMVAADSGSTVKPTLVPTVSTPAAPKVEAAASKSEEDKTTEDNRLSALLRENERLKSEIAPFNAEFFEELEDLKYRYTRLQEIVGEEPRAAEGARASALPLDRLSWSVRNSMTAMDRAGLTSPLVSRPRYANAFTYSPGGVANTVREQSPGPAARSASGYTLPGRTQEHVGGRVGGRGGIAATAHGAGVGIPGTRLTDPASSGPLGLARPFYETGEIDDFAPRTTSYERDYLDRQRPTSQYPPSLSHSRAGALSASFRPGESAAARMGGMHGIGAGTHSFVPDEAGGSFSNLCERRLAFELSQHPAPEQATRSLIHRVMDASSQEENLGFITCPQLSEVFHSVGLKLAPVEIELLATGFASNGKGAVDAAEFCEAVKTLLYNLIGEHAARAAEVQARYNGTLEGKDGAEDDIRGLMMEICEGIVAHDKRAVIGNSPNIYKTLLRPFVELDDNGSGLLDFRTFHDILKDIGVLLTHQDVLRVARYYAQPTDRAESAYPTSNLNHLQSFRDAKLKGSLRGASRSNPVVGNWLASSGVGLADAEAYYGDRNGEIGTSLEVDYNTFVTDLSEMLIKLLERDGGVVVGTRFPWILKEFEFVDALITQLEEMKPTQRRKVLMSLQYALSAADPKQECDLDGFTVLNALLGAGFRLQRVNRVRLLRAVEELGGKMDYRDLCQVLLNSCADWTSEEKQVVHKILKSMGVTVIERRNWLAKLRQSLMDASSKVARKSGRWFASEPGSQGGADEGPTASLGIPPSAFLHCLRDCGVVLTVEEEATLLDCLDTERLAKVGQIEAERGSAARGKESWSIPMIEYETFLQYCNRHCGSWTDAAPEINNAVMWAMKSISSPVLAVHEFASLMHAFDETSAGFVSKRAFQICCHRSRLLANLPEESITSLTDILAVDGGGKIDYTGFIVYLRATCSSLSGDAVAPGIIEQLVANGTDNKGTLLPLRNWLMRHTDMEAFILTPKDMNALLREFSVMYRPEDLEELQMDIGKHVDTHSLPLHAQRALKGTMDAELHMHSGNATQALKKHIIDSRDLMLQILKARPRWSVSHPYLCKRLLKAMQQAGTSQASATASLQHMDQYGSYDTTGAGTAAAENLSTYGSRRGGKKAGGPRGIETAVARRVLSRLRAFAGRSAISLGALDRETRERDGDTLMVERDIFKHLMGVTGLPLTDEDVLILADATDFLPEASRVRCDVILEALVGADHDHHERLVDEDGYPLEDASHRGGERPELTEACIFALDHLRDLLWKHAARLHRSTLEWVADVRTVVKGFDKTKSGFISSEDFSIALNLLNASVSQELLHDIVYVPEGPGLIDYNAILEYVLVPPSKAKPVTSDTLGAIQESRKPSLASTGGDRNAQSMTVKRKVVQKESPVQLLLNVIRKSLHHFIVSDHSLEQAWVCLLKVFQRFDPQETNQVNPRDFCLAVSVLLDGDDVVLTKSEWAEIIDHFASLGVQNAAQKRRQVDFLGGAMVDYMLFCETVLDPKEIKSRLTGEKQGNDRQNLLDRSKQFLSKSTPAQRRDSSAGRSSFSPSMSGHAGDLRSTAGGKDFHGHVVGSAYNTTGAMSSMLSKPPMSATNRSMASTYGSSRGEDHDGRPTSAPSHKSSRGLYIDKGDDEVLRRFQDAPRRSSLAASSSNKVSGGGALGYNNAGAAAAKYDASFDKFNVNNANIAQSSAGAKKSEWNTDELYRVARTQGQASRVTARVNKGASLRSPPRGTNVGGGGFGSSGGGAMQSNRATYASSHGKQSSGQSRFHWDAFRSLTLSESEPPTVSMTPCELRSQTLAMKANSKRMESHSAPRERSSNSGDRYASKKVSLIPRPTRPTRDVRRAPQMNQSSPELPRVAGSAKENAHADHEKPPAVSPHQFENPAEEDANNATVALPALSVSVREAEVNWQELLRLCRTAEGRGPDGSSPSPLFALQIVDIEDFFLPQFLPGYEPVEMDIPRFEQAAQDSVAYDRWLQWAAGNGAKPVPVRTNSTDTQEHAVHADASPVQTWEEWFSVSMDQWVLLRGHLTALTRSVDAPNYTFEHNMCAPLNTALLQCGLFLRWRNRADASDIDTDTTEDLEGALFADPGRDWADAYVQTSAFLPVHIFFFKSSLGRVRGQSQRLLDRVKVVRMAADAAWRALKQVPEHKRDGGLGCLSAHLFEEDEKGIFTMDVYYVAYNATRSCFECQCMMSFRVPTSAHDPSSAQIAINALVCYRMVVLFLQAQQKWWDEACDYRMRSSSGSDYMWETTPPYAFIPTPQTLHGRIEKAMGSEIRIQYETLEDYGHYCLWQGAPYKGGRVSLKLQSNRHHLRELSALCSARGVAGVPRSTRSYTVDTRLMVLVHEWLYDIDYKSLLRSEEKVLKFAQDVCGILASIHERNVFHCAIDPWKFRIDSKESLVLTDFTRSHVGHARLQNLSGDPWFVFPGTPLERAEQCDCVGLGGVLGWILGIPRFGCAAPFDMAAMQAVLDELAARANRPPGFGSPATEHARALQEVEKFYAAVPSTSAKKKKLAKLVLNLVAAKMSVAQCRSQLLRPAIAAPVVSAPVAKVSATNKAGSGQKRGAGQRKNG